MHLISVVWQYRNKWPHRYQTCRYRCIRSAPSMKLIALNTCHIIQPDMMSFVSHNAVIGQKSRFANIWTRAERKSRIFFVEFLLHLLELMQPNGVWSVCGNHDEPQHWTRIDESRKPKDKQCALNESVVAQSRCLKIINDWMLHERIYMCCTFCAHSQTLPTDFLDNPTTTSGWLVGRLAVLFSCSPIILIAVFFSFLLLNVRHLIPSSFFLMFSLYLVQRSVFFRVCAILRHRLLFFFIDAYCLPRTVHINRENWTSNMCGWFGTEWILICVGSLMSSLCHCALRLLHYTIDMEFTCSERMREQANSSVQ